MSEAELPEAAIAFIREHIGSVEQLEVLLLLRADAAQLQSLMQPAAPAGLDGPIWIVDPLGNLMMRWPADADPNRMKRDLGKLLRASRVG